MTETYRGGKPASEMRPPSQWLDELGPPVAKVERAGRWTHLVYISHGLSRYGPEGYGWHRLGAQRAIRKAERELRRYTLREERSRQVVTVNAKASQ